MSAGATLIERTTLRPRYLERLDEDVVAMHLITVPRRVIDLTVANTEDTGAVATESKIAPAAWGSWSRQITHQQGVCGESWRGTRRCAWQGRAATAAASNSDSR